MGVRASFQAVSPQIFEIIKSQVPDYRAADISLLYPPKGQKSEGPIESGIGAWWVLQTAFNHFGPPLIHAIQGELMYQNGIDTQGEVAFDGDHYLGHVSSTTTQAIAARLATLDSDGCIQVLPSKDRSSPSVKEDLATLRTFYKKAADAGRGVLIIIA